LASAELFVGDTLEFSGELTTPLVFPAEIWVDPLEIRSSQYTDQVTTRPLEIGNVGIGDLQFDVRVEFDPLGPRPGAAADPDRSQPGPVGALAADETATLPGARSGRGAFATPAAVTGGDSPRVLSYREDFESGGLDDWTDRGGAGTKDVTTATAAEGSHSFHYLSTGPGSHFHGISQQFAAGSRPDYVAFWLRD